MHGFDAGLIEYCGEDATCPVQYEHYAAGSGAQAALGAMKMGVPASRAVEIAAEVDVNTGLPVVVFDTRTCRFPRQRRKKRSGVT